MSASVLKGSNVIVINENDEIEHEGVRSVAQDAFERGKAEATQALEDQISLLRDAITQVAETGCQEVAASARLDAELITRLAADLAAWFLSDVIEADPALLMRSIKAALAKLADETNLVLWVNPQVADALDGQENLAVEAVRGDASLEPADFRLVADGTSVERRWRDAFEQVGPALVATVHSIDE